MDDKVILDTNIYVGIAKANCKKCEDLQDYIIDHPNWIVVMCPKLRAEIERVLDRMHFGIHQVYRHVFHHFKKAKKFMDFEEKDIPNKCSISDNDDIHLIECAIGSNCTIIVTNDGKLKVSPECQVHIKSISEFYQLDNE